MKMKRTLAVFLLGLLCLSMFSVFALEVRAQESTVDWWPTLHHDLTHAGYSTSTGPLTNQLLWNYTTGNIVDYSSPAVINGEVYVGSNDNYVYALDAATGAYIWSYKTGNSIDSSPAVADGIVYVGSEDHNVYALNATTGTKIWSYGTGDEVESSPAVANGVVYIGSDDNNLYALNATSGDTIWTYGTGNLVDSSPAVANGVVYVGSNDDNVYAFGTVEVSVPEFPNQALNFISVTVMVCAAFAAIITKKEENQR